MGLIITALTFFLTILFVETVKAEPCKDAFTIQEAIHTTSTDFQKALELEIGGNSEVAVFILGALPQTDFGYTLRTALSDFNVFISRTKPVGTVSGLVLFQGSIFKEGWFRNHCRHKSASDWRRQQWLEWLPLEKRFALRTGELKTIS